MKKKLLIAGLAGITLCAACSNNDDPKPADVDPFVIETKLVQQKWDFVKQVFIDYDPSTGPDSVETVSSGGDYVDFKPNGYAYSFIDGELDTVSYIFAHSDSIIIEDTYFKVIQLDSANFHIQSYTAYPDGSYEQGIIELKR